MSTRSIQAGDAVRTKLGERRLVVSAVLGDMADVHWYEGARFRSATVPVRQLTAWTELGRG